MDSSPVQAPVPGPSPADVVRRFVEAINRRDVEGIIALVTEDHRLIDALGEVITGEEDLRRAWHIHFTWFPNYEISIGQILTDGETVAIFGRAGGTYRAGRGTVGENTWLLPAAWRAVVREGRIALWQVYGDTQPVAAIMERTDTGRRNGRG